MTRDLREPHCRAAVMLAGAGVLAAWTMWPAGAQADVDDIELSRYHGIEVLAANDLGEMRGAFIDAFGIMVEFGAEIRTIIDGTPVFQTNLLMNETGGFDRTLVFLPDPTIDLAASGVSSVMTAGGVEIQLVGELGMDLTDVLPSNVDLTGLNGASGFVIQDGTGVTAILHDVEVGRLVNTIANTGSGRDVTQEMDVTITLHNMESFTENARLERLRSALGTF